MLQQTNHPVHVIGCGYLGRKLLQQILDRSLADAGNIQTVVKTQHSLTQCLAMGVQGFALDLDNPDARLPGTYSIEDALLYYFTPPPGHGTQDGRAHNFLAQINHASSKRPAKIVLISTTGVYGDCQGHWVTEKTPLKPKADRARRRVDAEQQFQRYCQHHDIPLVILRVSGIYGPGKLPLKRIKAQTPIVREQDSPFSNRIHIDDLVAICLQAGFDANIEGIFNCADGNPSTMYDYFVRVARASHLPEPPVITLEQAQSQLSPGMLSYMEESRRIDNHKLITEFAITLKYPDLEKGLAFLE